MVFGGTRRRGLDLTSMSGDALKREKTRSAWRGLDLTSMSGDALKREKTRSA